MVRNFARSDSNWTCCSRKLWLLAKDDSEAKPPEYRLHEALRNGTDAEVELILNENPSLVNEPAEFGYTPLHIATIKKRYSAMKLLLLRGADSMIMDKFGCIPLQRAIIEDDQTATEILLRVCDNRNIIFRSMYSLLDIALTESSSGIVSLLLSCGIKPREINRRNAFLRLTERYSDYSMDEDDLETTGRHLLSAGLDFYDNGGRPCEWAIRFDNHHALRVLLKLGAKILHPYWALDLAAKYATLETIEILREAKIKGIDPDVADDDVWTILETFECREAEVWLPLQTSPTAEDSAAFRLLIDEVRERYNQESLLLETAGSENDMSKNNNGLSGKEGGEATGDKVCLPGAWVE
ncbi:ankyrin repeat-containing domain protein [Nemania serpens]|nr:ankyrin repeat-containing domain protein [Nemania serpens]